MGETQVDLAIRVVRGFQSADAAVSQGHLAEALKPLTASDLKWVALATRIPVKTLEELRG